MKSTLANDNLIDWTRDGWQRQLERGVSVSWQATSVLARSHRMHTRNEPTEIESGRWIASKRLLASSTSPFAIARALGWQECLKDFVYPTPSKALEFNTATDDQGESSLEPEKQLLGWQGEIARDAQQGHGIDALQRVLSEVKNKFGVDQAFLFHAIDDLQQCANRHLSGHYATEIITSIFGAIFPNLNSTLDDKTIKIDAANEIKRLAKLTPIEYGRERKLAAEKLGCDRLADLDDAVKTARAENGGRGRQGRKPTITETEPWPEPPNLADTLDQAVAAYSRYLILPRGGAEKMALWSMGTHCFHEFPIFPRLAVTSPVKECAKSLLLRVLKCTSAHPVIMTNANIAPLFRMISVCRPSIFLDEADNYLKDKPDLLALLNDGYADGGRVWRCEGENNEVKEFDVFAPVAIAMINRPPPTLLSRSIEIRMQRKRPGQTTANFRGDRVDPVLSEIQRKFARVADDSAAALRSADPDMNGLLNRDADNWRPMFALAELAGGEWIRRVRELAQAAVASKDAESTKEQLLADLLLAFQTRNTNRLSSEAAIEFLTGLDERPWPEWKNGKPLTKVGLARQLSTFGILSGTVRLDDGRTLKGYKREDFKEAFEQYLPPQSVTSSQTNDDGQCDALQNVTPAKPVTLSETSQHNNDGHCDDVTVCADVDEKEETWTV